MLLGIKLDQLLPVSDTFIKLLVIIVISILVLIIEEPEKITCIFYASIYGILFIGKQ